MIYIINVLVIEFSYWFTLHTGSLHLIIQPLTVNTRQYCGDRITNQGTKKFRSDSPGLVDFVVGLVEFIFRLPNGQVKVFRETFL